MRVNLDPSHSIPFDATSNLIAGVAPQAVGGNRHITDHPIAVPRQIGTQQVIAFAHFIKQRGQVRDPQPVDAEPVGPAN